MESRWKFLHPAQTELQGRGQEAGAGRGKPGASGRGAREENPLGRNPKTRCGPKIEVGKTVEWLPRKAAMALCGPVPETDTGGWGENPKAGGRSIVKELGKMAP